MPLTRLKQVGILKETTYGTFRAQALTDPLNFKHLCLPTPVLDLTPTFFERDFLRASQTPTQNAVGTKPVRGSFRLEMSGDSASPSDIPTWDDWMRMAGFISKATEFITIGAVTGGPFRHNELITQATTGATARVVHDTWNGNTRLLIRDKSGAPNGTNIWTGGTSAASATPSTAPADAGQSWYPGSQPTVVLTYTGGTVTGAGAGGPSGAFAVGDIIQDATNQAKGVVLAITATGTSPTITGTITVRVYNGQFGAGNLINEIPEDPGNKFVCTQSGVQDQTDMPTYSMSLLEDGTFKTATGVRADWTLSGRTGEPVIMQFDVQGVHVSEGDRALHQGVVFESKVPPLLLGSCLKLGLELNTSDTQLYDARVSSFRFSGGNRIAPIGDMCKASGISFMEITGRNPTGEIVFDHDLEASYPVLLRLKDGDVGRIKMDIGSVAANRFYITAPGLQFTQVPFGDADGIAQKQSQFRFTGGRRTNAADSPGEDNEIVITYLLI